ncbi:hypothetical protein [Geobacter sp. AOG1]|uniref:hypothetical protein n=1 Tax=Geobacter sp. AOG1 TaxID=1566346 RepID=UPI001CC38238|nr:hypothetical protein [Geobacter sp. AOG1]GFE59278.1 hypothetical protein AOG1_31580 [Geobacter sp. AOG1]
MKMKWLVVIGLIVVAFSSGCTRSFDVAYQADAARLSNATELEKYSLGVAKFEDKRAWVEEGNVKSESFVALQGPWKFGMTYKETDYIPVKDLLQELLVQELTKAGFKAKALDKVLSKSNAQSIKELNKEQTSDYIIGGQLLSFEFVNETGFLTVTSRRNATLNLNLFDGKSSDVLIDTVINETDREGEGMGVMHSTNIEKLMNRVFKKVAQQVIQKTADKVSQSQAQK